MDAPNPLRAAPELPADAGVSFIMPVLQERRHLGRAVASVLAQRARGPVEVVLALGPSTDGTTGLAARLAARDPRIVLIANPRGDISGGLNAALEASSHPLVVRVDAHTELPEGYVLRAADALRGSGAASVGGVMHAVGRGKVQRAAARAYNSRIGLGGVSYHSGGAAGEAESAYLGVMHRRVLEEIGGYDPSLRRGEDWDLSQRIRAAGYRVWFDPRLRVTYWPRDRWGLLSRQFHATGIWRGELVRRHRRRNGLRYFAPPALVLSFSVSAAVGVLQAAGVLRGRASVLAGTAHLPVLAYTAVMAGFAAQPGSGPGLAERLRSAAVLPVMHLSWGAGFLRGLVGGARDAVDTSRPAVRSDSDLAGESLDDLGAGQLGEALSVDDELRPAQP